MEIIILVAIILLTALIATWQINKNAYKRRINHRREIKKEFKRLYTALESLEVPSHLRSELIDSITDLNNLKQLNNILYKALEQRSFFQ